MSERFRQIAERITVALGSVYALVAAALVIIVWLLTGPIFNFSDTWQLVINTTTTIVTFLMIFAVQNTQNRDAKAVHIKLDEIIRSIDNARNAIIGTEKAPEKEVEQREREMERAAKK